jgi:hypothetical protein
MEIPFFVLRGPRALESGFLAHSRCQRNLVGFVFAVEFIIPESARKDDEFLVYLNGIFGFSQVFAGLRNYLAKGPGQERAPGRSQPRN